MPLPHIHIPFQKIRKYSDFIKKITPNLEIYFSSDVLDIVTDKELTSIMQVIDYNPSLSVHAPFMDLSPGAVDSGIRKVTMERFFHVISISERLKAVAIVFHSGYEKWKYDFNVELWLEKSLMTWRPVNKMAIDAGINVAVENIFEDNPANLKMLMQNMNSDNFGICFDTGHCNLFSKVSLEDWMEALNPYILELHLHDNDGSADQHHAIGRGTFDFRRFFSLLRHKDCLYTIEAHTPENVVESLGYLRNIKGP